MKEYVRIVVEEDCTGCQTCDVACKQEHGLPVGLRWTQVLPDGPREIDGKLQLRYSVRDCMHYNQPPCQEACPAGVDAYGYISLISQGKFGEALEVLRQTMPFAGVCGRVCIRPCEIACERVNVDEAVPIRWLKRFMADYELSVGREKGTPNEKTKKDKVAIIGSGPAGLACAYDLIRKGYPVTVFEAAPKSGGLLRYGTPEYRLPEKALDNDIDYVKELGVEIKTNTPVKDLKKVFEQGYKAIFLGTGAWLSQKMGIPDEDAEGVIDAMDFLNQVNSGSKVKLGQRVAVIGGGNAAIDAARVAKRLGAKEVDIVYRRSRAEMPAESSEVEGAEQEGVKLRILAAPVKVLTKGNRVTGIQCIRMELGEPDASGRRRPVPVEGSEFDMGVDNVIMAIGQGVDKKALPKELEYTDLGTLKVDQVTLQTNIKGVFAGGDVVSGPADVVAAVAAGKEAATSIDRYLRGLNLLEGRLPTASIVRRILTERVPNRMRQIMPLLKPEERVKSFAEVQLGLNEKTAIEEATKCFTCGVCIGRLDSGMKPACAAACSARCIHFNKV